MSDFSEKTFRFACDEAEIPEVEALLAAEGYIFEPEEFSPWARRLVSGPASPGASLAAIFGLIYIQDRSAMLPPLALGPVSDAFCLDMCASPGGKSGFLAVLGGKKTFVLANEPNPVRNATLTANLERSGLLTTGVCKFKGQQLPLPENFFPYILLDPPCSGWGTVKKHPRTMKIWRGGKIAPLVFLQRELLRKAAALLAPGGKLLYSTCTTNIEENELQTAFAVNELGLERLPLAPFPGFVFKVRPGGEGCLLVDGEASGAQGFYLSLLRKPEDGKNLASENELDKTLEHLAKMDGEIGRDAMAGPFCDPDLLPPGYLAKAGNIIRFYPAFAMPFARAINWEGIAIGSENGGVFRPYTRMRRLLPKKPDPAANLMLEDVKTLRALISGQSIQTGFSGKACGLWWRSLPLGLAPLKLGRIMAPFK